ncbi:MAG: hypothetical protein ABI840_11690, partial [bacterium]
YIELFVDIFYISNYYKINVSKQQLRFDKDNNLLSKKTLENIEDTSSTIGYYGQLISEKIYNAHTFNTFIETNYEYCRNDTTGKYIFYGTGIFPYKEGNLKLTRINNQETQYFYHPINLDEVYKGFENADEPPGIPYLKYKIKFNNGNVVNSYAKIWDFRFPIRTENYKIIGSSRQSMSITYKSYTLDGSPSKMIDQNKYLTQFVYEPIHRINSITLPGDFSTSPDSTALTIFHNYYQTEKVINMDGFGYFNFLKDTLFYSRNFNSLTQGCCPFINSSVIMQNEVYSTRIGTFFYFDTNIVKSSFNLFSIDSTVLHIFPYSSSYIPAQSNKNIAIQIIRKINSSFPIDSCGICGSQGNTVLINRTKISSFGSNVILYPLYTNIPFVENTFDIRSIIPLEKNFIGMILSPSLPANAPIPFIDHNLSINFAYQNTLSSSYYPFIVIKGTIDNADTLKIPIIKGGTIKYYYDDIDHTVNVYSVRNTLNNERSKVQYSIDGFGNVKQKDIFFTETHSNSYTYKFNYMNMPARNFDALNDSTMFSYDGLGRLIRTKNSDTSSTVNSYSYYNSLSSYFSGTFSGFIERQLFTDEEGNNFEKYFDAVGNLRREAKYIQVSPNSEVLTALVTDYRYDSLYRLIRVKTPEGKNIFYSYDGYGRQSKRVTVDAGQTDFYYDKNSNLIFSQDAVQKNVNSGKYTFRNYDGLNRLTGIGEAIFAIENPGDEIQYAPTSPDAYLTVNVYDTVTNSVVTNLFTSSLPSGYNGQNYTKGNLAATAFRTRSTDGWSFKYYRYDQRGRVTKMWNMINGFDTLITEYEYNSQDQITYLTYMPGTGGQEKKYEYQYDYAGRLNKVGYYSEIEATGYYKNFTSYQYNANSQVEIQSYIDRAIVNNFNYDNRNRINTQFDDEGIFQYTNSYFKNGNVKLQLFEGTYSDNAVNTGALTFTNTYDRCNRLLNSSSG